MSRSGAALASRGRQLTLVGVLDGGEWRTGRREGGSFREVMEHPVLPLEQRELAEREHKEAEAHQEGGTNNQCRQESGGGGGGGFTSMRSLG